MLGPSSRSYLPFRVASYHLPSNGDTWNGGDTWDLFSALITTQIFLSTLYLYIQTYINYVVYLLKGDLAQKILLWL